MPSNHRACCCGSSLPPDCQIGGTGCPTCIKVVFSGITCCDMIVTACDFSGIHQGCCDYMTTAACENIFDDADPNGVNGEWIFVNGGALASGSCIYTGFKIPANQHIVDIVDPAPCHGTDLGARYFGRVRVQMSITGTTVYRMLLFTSGFGMAMFYNYDAEYSLGETIPNWITECSNNALVNQMSDVGLGGTAVVTSLGSCGTCPENFDCALIIAGAGTACPSGCTEIATAALPLFSKKVASLEDFSGTHNLGEWTDEGDGTCSATASQVQAFDFETYGYPIENDCTGTELYFKNTDSDSVCGGSGPSYKLEVIIDKSTFEVLQIEVSATCGSYVWYVFFYQAAAASVPTQSARFVGQTIASTDDCAATLGLVSGMLTSGATAQVKLIDTDTGELLPCPEEEE